MTLTGDSSFVRELLQSEAAADPYEAIHRRSDRLIQEFFRVFPVSAAGPVNIEAVASYIGISFAEERPQFSQDAELAPRDGGGVEIRINPDRPETRRRFSIAHEIGHTFFPNYFTRTWCRPDHRCRTRLDPEQLVEMLCDVAASRLLMPEAFFREESCRVTSARDLLTLAETFRVSREALIRRYVGVQEGPMAAIFLSWRLKPMQERRVGLLEQRRLFGDPEEEIRNAKKLRVDYAVPNQAFSRAGLFVPPAKSFSGGPVLSVASTGQPDDAECELDLGAKVERFRVFALPVWTADEERGPTGQCGVAAVLQPVDGNHLPGGRRSLLPES